MHNSSVYPKHILPAVEPMYDLKQLHFYNYFIARLCSVYGSAVERGYRITLDSNFNFKYAESHRQAYKRLVRIKHNCSIMQGGFVICIDSEACVSREDTEGRVLEERERVVNEKGSRLLNEIGAYDF